MSLLSGKCAVVTGGASGKQRYPLKHLGEEEKNSKSTTTTTSDRKMSTFASAAGIGEACVRAFVAQGARVVIADLQRSKGLNLVKELGADTVVYVHCDVTNEGDVVAAVKAALDNFGALDVMVNNAGVVGGLGPVETMGFAEFERTVQINLTGVLLGTKHAIRAMKAAGTAGCIINTSSISALGGAAPAAAGYTAAKAGVIGLTRQAACEVAQDGIRVVAVAPGITATPMANLFVQKGSSPPSEEDVQRFVSRTSPLKGALLLPQDIANAFVFLASDMGRCVNAHTLVVDLGVAAGVTGKPPAFSRREPGFLGAAGQMDKPASEGATLTAKL